MAFKPKPKLGQPLPKLPEGYTRTGYTNIEGSTSKATLFVFDELKIWIPNSCFKIVEYEKGVVDIKSWFYDKEIGI